MKGCFVKDNILYIPRLICGYKKIKIKDIHYIAIGGCGYYGSDSECAKDRYGKIIPNIALLSNMNFFHKDFFYLFSMGSNEGLILKKFNYDLFDLLLSSSLNCKIYVWHEIYNETMIERWSDYALKGILDIEKVNLVFKNGHIN